MDIFVCPLHPPTAGSKILISDREFNLAMLQVTTNCNDGTLILHEIRDSFYVLPSLLTSRNPTNVPPSQRSCRRHMSKNSIMSNFRHLRLSTFLRLAGKDSGLRGFYDNFLIHRISMNNPKGIFSTAHSFLGEMWNYIMHGIFMGTRWFRNSLW